MAVNRNQTSAKGADGGRPDTNSRILDVAERLVQSRGFNGFSYADVAIELNITKASLHYHFPGKADLGRALIERYESRFTEALDAIDQQEPDPLAKLEAYAKIYADVLSELTYEDGTSRYEYVIFADSARKSGILQYLDNRQVYGYITFGDHEYHVSDGFERAREFLRDADDTPKLIGATASGAVQARPEWATLVPFSLTRSNARSWQA